MISMIKEIGIFIVIAQAVLYFVPGEAYAKYVKVIIGIIMIAKMAQPVLSLATGEEWEEIMEQAAAFADGPGIIPEEFQPEGSSRDVILSGIEEELKDRLKGNSVEGYRVRTVSVNENESGEVIGITITVSETDEGGGQEIKIGNIVIEDQGDGKQDMTEQEANKLREYYGNLLSVPAEQIEVCIR